MAWLTDLDLRLSEEPGSYLEDHTLVLQEWPDGATHEGATVRRTIDLALKVVDASLVPEMTFRR